MRTELIEGTNADPVMTLAATAHLRMAPMLGLPQQLSPSAAASAIASYVTSFAERYGPNGSFWAQNPTLPYLPVTRFEIGNEPNMPLQWVADETHLHWSDPAAYAQVYEAARAALHSVDPSGVAIVGGLADSGGDGVDLQSDEQWLAAITGPIDAVGFHPYTFDVSDSLMNSDTEALRQWMDADGLGSAPLDINEFDACDITSSTTVNVNACPDSGQQSSGEWGAVVAAYTQWALCTPGLNVEAVLPFYWGGTPTADSDAWLTLTTTAGQPTPYGQAYLDEAHALTTVGCPPINTSAPTISGTAAPGQTLTGASGTWSSSQQPTIGYQWRRCDSGGNNCQDIAGATSATYQIQAADNGSALVLAVTASNQGGDTTALSAPTGAIGEPSAGNGASTSAPTVGATAARARPAPAALEISHIRLRVSHGRTRLHLVTLTAQIASAAKLAGVVARRGHHRTSLHRRRRRHRHLLAEASRVDPAVTFTARLKPGRWTITLVFLPSPEYAVPLTVSRTIMILI